MINTEVLSYLDLMHGSLIKKDKALTSILSVTQSQEKLLGEPAFNEEVFFDTLRKKDSYIEEINRLDEGFELTYSRIKDFIKDNPSMYESRITALQALIKKLVEKSIEIETSERRNKIKFDIVLNKGKEKIRSYNIKSNVATKYYSNMNGGGVGTDTYFLDKKK